MPSEFCPVTLVTAGIVREQLRLFPALETDARPVKHPKEWFFPTMNAADYLETEDGAKIYYEDHGEGQPILLVHGWLCSPRFWQKNVPELATKFRVFTIDLRGHGNSTKVLAGHTIRHYARDVRDVIEHMGFTNLYS
jgi:hypothetical protein